MVFRKGRCSESHQFVITSFQRGRKERYRLEFHWASEKLIPQLVRTMGRTLKKLSISKQYTCDLERIMCLKKHIGLEVHC
jgi:hypothetical protein